MTWNVKTIFRVITDEQSDLLEISMKNTMRNTLLVTVAATALIAGAGLASAQGAGGEAPGPATHEPKAPGGKIDQHSSSVPPKSPAPTALAPTKEKPTETAQAPSVAKPQAAEHGGNPKASEPPNSRMTPSTATDETKSGPPAALSTEQHAKIRDTLRVEKSERLTSVPFSTKVGEAIPGTVHLYVLPVSIMEYAPQYRGYEYILVGDEILIVDPRTLRIVAVLDA
jgi:hypothetical protein